MSKKEYISVQFNTILWRIERLGDNVYILIAPKNISIEKIHQSTFQIKEILGRHLNDIVPAYHSIAVFTEKSLSDLAELLQESTLSGMYQNIKKDPLQVPVCYELGLDLTHVAINAGMTANEVIALHLSGNYTSVFIGFTPGFVYADGLDERLATPRKTTPRKKLEAGSVGIGGSQTGIYSLASPGGWNILGRTPLKIFDVTRENPMLIEAGTPFHFHRISKEEFATWGN